MRNLDDSDSWRTFFDTYWRLIYNVARKRGLSDDQAQEVVQETVIAVARKMPEFHYDPAKGSFKRWLLLICQRRIHDHLRRHYSAIALVQPERVEPGHSTDDLPGPVPPPDTQIIEAWEEEWRENIFQTALA